MLPQQKVLPLIESDADKEVSYSRIILVEPVGTNDPISIWIPTILHFSSQKRCVVLGLNPRLQDWCQVFQENNVQLIPVSITNASSFIDSNADKLDDSICFVDSFNLLLSLNSTKLIEQLEVVSRIRKVVFIVSLDSTPDLSELPNRRTVDLLRSIAFVRLIFRSMATENSNGPTWQLETLSTSVRSGRMTRKTQVVSTRSATRFELVKKTDERVAVTGQSAAKATDLFNVPFNLSLTDSEEASRRSVVLPHSKIVGRHDIGVQELDVFERSKDVGLEDEDGFDYEKMKNELDPDDDLDI